MANLGYFYINRALLTNPSRRNRPGDREKALSVILPILQSGEPVASDVYCLCGRIYKDMFLSSGFKDVQCRDQASYWWESESRSYTQSA